MFNKTVKLTVVEMDKTIQSHTELLAKEQVGSEEYKRIEEALDTLVEVRNNFKPKGMELPKSDTIITGLVSLASIALILKYEKVDIITTKAFGVATKMLGR